MSDALRLPEQPSLEFYRKLAKDFQRASRTATPTAILEWGEQWRERAKTDDVELPRKLQHLWKRLLKERPAFARGGLSDAQFFIARVHGFASWPIFAKHIEALARETSGTVLFESAVDAIVSGNTVTLNRLLQEHPDLVRQRSTREHQATLLHYVSANGVEDFRQKTPKNIVEIARLLLDAGADVNAVSNSYGTGDTTFMLTATSCHPQDAGVQIPLLELLLARGARVDGSDVTASLHNGRDAAALFCAKQNVRLDLEGAAGVGDLDVVKTFLRPDGTLINGATEKQKIDGFAWAAEYGRIAVVEYMIDAGVPLDSRLRHDGQTALHWAGLGGHADTVRLLVARGAPVNEKDLSYQGTPLDWTIYGWGNRLTFGDGDEERYYDAVKALVDAGAILNANWLDVSEDAERGRAKKKLEADPRMMALLRRRA